MIIKDEIFAKTIIIASELDDDDYSRFKDDLAEKNETALYEENIE